MITHDQEKFVKDLFSRRHTIKRGSKRDIEYRAYLADELSRMFKFFIETCKVDWNRKYNIDASDAESLIMYSLLKSIDSYGLRRSKKEQFIIDKKRKEVTRKNNCLKDSMSNIDRSNFSEYKIDYWKDVYAFGRYLKFPSSSFQTYFWSVCVNDLTNYLKSKRRPKTNPHFCIKEVINKTSGKSVLQDKLIFPSTLSLTSTSYNDCGEENNRNVLEDKLSIDYYRRYMTLQDKKDRLDDVFFLCSKREKEILTHLYRGFSVLDVQKMMRLSKQSIYLSLHSIGEKFNRIVC